MRYILVYLNRAEFNLNVSIFFSSYSCKLNQKLVTGLLRIVNLVSLVGWSEF